MENNTDLKPNLMLNRLTWLAVIALTCAGIFANHYFGETAWAVRLAGWVVLSCVILLIAVQTVEGKKILAFAKEARVELRKVVWPTREETVKTTMIISALVVAVALLLWGADSILLWAVGWLSGQGG